MLSTSLICDSSVERVSHNNGIRNQIMMVIQKHILCQGNAKWLSEKLKHNVKYKTVQNYKHSINQN